MRARDPRAFLYDIAEASARIADFTAGLTIEDYRRDAMLRSAVERQFEIIGEALNLLNRVDPITAGRVTDASRIIAFRNRLIHGYATVSDEVVWGVVEASLPMLVQDVKRLLNELETRRSRLGPAPFPPAVASSSIVSRAPVSRRTRPFRSRTAFASPGSPYSARDSSGSADATPGDLDLGDDRRQVGPRQTVEGEALEVSGDRISSPYNRLLDRRPLAVAAGDTAGQG